MVLFECGATGIIDAQYLILFTPQKILAMFCKRSALDVNYRTIHLTYHLGESIENSINKHTILASYGQDHRCIDNNDRRYSLLTQALR